MQSSNYEHSNVYSWRLEPLPVYVTLGNVHDLSETHCFFCMNMGGNKYLSDKTVVGISNEICKVSKTVVNA